MTVARSRLHQLFLAGGIRRHDGDADDGQRRSDLLVAGGRGPPGVASTP